MDSPIALFDVSPANKSSLWISNASVSPGPSHLWSYKAGA